MRRDARSPVERTKLWTLIVAAAIGLPSVSFVPAHAAEPPSLRLLVASQEVTLQREGRRVPLDVGVYLAPAGGAFEIHAARADYDSPIRATQMEAGSGQVLKDIPAEVVDGWRGLNDFIRVRIRNQDGKTVVDRRLNFCPNDWDRQRLNDLGPASPTYPSFPCMSGFPFTKGMVWGIDEHWATNALTVQRRYYSRAPGVRLPNGSYSVTIKIPAERRRLFGIARADGKVVLDVEIEDFAGRGQEAGSETDEKAGRQGLSQAPTVTEPDPSTLPDLVALPVWNVDVRSRPARDLLTFAATPWNAGPSRLVVEGFRRTSEDAMDAFQYFYDPAGEVAGRAPVGTMRFDRRDGHDHWHFTQFVAYKLIDTGSDQEVVRSGKQSFCIAPTDPIDLTREGAAWTAGREELWSACGDDDSLWVREVLQAGWGDTYFQWVAGQAFDITDVPNGWYEIKTILNPKGKLYDKDPSNDVETRLIHLSGKPGDREVLVAPWHGITD